MLNDFFIRINSTTRIRKLTGTLRYFRREMEKQSNRNTWVLGATGYVGQLVTHRLFSQREKGNWSGQLITLGQKTIVPWIMERTNFHLFPLNSIPQMLLKRYTPSAIYHCARMAGNSDRARRIAVCREVDSEEPLTHRV